MEFYRISHQTVMDGLVVTYKEIGPSGGLKISASRAGVKIDGHSPIVKSVQEIHEVLDRAKEMQRIIVAGKSHGFEKIRSSDIDMIRLDQEPDCVMEARKAVFCGDDVILESRIKDTRSEVENA